MITMIHSISSKNSKKKLKVTLKYLLLIFWQPCLHAFLLQYILHVNLNKWDHINGSVVNIIFRALFKNIYIEV